MGLPATLPIPDEVVRIAKRLEDAGHETWCVGGAIRDNLLGLPNHDFDLTTSAPPAEVQKVFKRTVPVGIEHGTVAVLDAHGKAHEVTTFRKDIHTDGRHATVEFGVSLMDDLARRDFTINAIAYHPIRHEWRDPFHGEQDLDKKLIRSVGDPNWRFQEDYLRILRALRFSARFEFRIHARTLEAAKANAQGLAQLSAERVRDEWFKGIQTAKKVSKLVGLWREVGATRIWLPETGAGTGEQGARRSWPRIRRHYSLVSSAPPRTSNGDARLGSGVRSIPSRRIPSRCGGGWRPLVRTPTIFWRCSLLAAPRSLTPSRRSARPIRR